jgi:predicted MarR family transcription regulator
VQFLITEIPVTIIFAKQTGCKTPIEMKDNVLACIFPFVQEYNDSPFSPQIIASTTKCDDVREIERVFKQLKSEGLITRKHLFTSVYRVTDEGLKAAQKAYDEQQQKTNNEQA